MKFITILLFCNASFLWAGAQLRSEDIVMTEARFFPLEKTIYYQLGERTIPVKVTRYGSASKIVCINLHDNENTSVLAAHAVLQETGGTLIRLENNGERVITFQLRGTGYSFDPNRIFSKTGIEESLRENGTMSPLAKEEVEKFSRRLLELIPDSIQTVIALHNNADAGYSVKSYLPGGDRENDASEVYADEIQDADDIIFTTDPVIYRKMAAFGYNSILQNNRKAKKDGSLSVYYGALKRSYVNIETEHGKVTQYREMLAKVVEILHSGKAEPVDK